MVYTRRISKPINYLYSDLIIQVFELILLLMMANLVLKRTNLKWLEFDTALDGGESVKQAPCYTVYSICNRLYAKHFNIFKYF